mgnify:CR=1 FL=1
MSYKIQHLSIGGVLDQSITLVKNHFGLLFQIMLMVWIPWVILGNGIVLAMMPALPPNPTLADVLAVQAKIGTISLIISLVTAFILMPWASASVMYAVSQLYLGKSASALSAVKFGAGRLLPIFWTTIVTSIAIGFGLILLIVPGILFAMWFGLAQQVCVLENTIGFKALPRSKQLVRPYLGSFLALGILVVVIAIGMNVGVGFIPEMYTKLVVSAVLGAIVTVFQTATFVIFYFSCRCGVENFDLYHLASAVGESVATLPAQSETTEAT